MSNARVIAKTPAECPGCGRYSHIYRIELTDGKHAGCQWVSRKCRECQEAGIHSMMRPVEEFKPLVDLVKEVLDGENNAN